MDSQAAHTTMSERIDAFLEQVGLDDTDEVRNAIADLTIGCWSDMFKHLIPEPIPRPAVKSSGGSSSSNSSSSGSPKKTKETIDINQLDDSVTVDELQKASVVQLDTYLREHGILISGNKSDKVSRVYRSLRGESLKTDFSSKSKVSVASSSATKKTSPKKEVEKHACVMLTAKGTQCTMNGTNEYGGYHFCWKHVDKKEEYVASIEEEPEPETEPVVTKPKKRIVAKKQELEEEDTI